jgi:hypothetical protein
VLDAKSGAGDVRIKKRFEGEAAVIKSKQKFRSEGSMPPVDSVRPRDVVAMFLRLGSLIRPLPTGSQRT